MIPCIFWFVQKGMLLQETPLFANGEVNESRLQAASRVFGVLWDMQNKPYADLRSEEKVRWYFLRLDLAFLQSVPEDVMDRISDRVRHGDIQLKLKRNSLDHVAEAIAK